MEQNKVNPNLYNRKYFLEDGGCKGWKEFGESNGKGISPRIEHDK